MIFNFLIGFIFSFNSLAVTDADAWVVVKKGAKVEEVPFDIDPSIWVLFFKKVGSEKFSLRFPEDPTFLEVGGVTCYRAFLDEEVFEVIIEEPPSAFLAAGPQTMEDGKWVSEQIVQTEEHLFRLRGYSPDSNSRNVAEFFSSFAFFS